MIVRFCLVLALAMCGPVARAVSCEDIRFDNASYTVCEVDARKEDMALFLRDDSGSIYGQFSRIDASLEPVGKNLVFAMNAGMYHDDRSPVGHYKENGTEVRRVIANAGPGNFGMLPNGVFCLRSGRADVIETLDYLEEEPNCEHATQSGPMLVIDGALHPRFLPNSTSVYIRNGVGTDTEGARTVFAISNEPVNFHSFGRLFRDHLKLSNALYFDGNISRLYARDIGRSDFGFSLGPIVGVIEPLE